MTDRIFERPREEKEAYLTELRSKFSDSYEFGDLDPGILDTVVILNTFDFQTVGSCEGYIQRRGGRQNIISSFGPWVNMNFESPFKAYQEATRLTHLLEDFYQNRNTPYHAILIADRQSAKSVKLWSIGTFRSDDLPETDQAERVRIYQKEMQDFTSFLYARFME